MVPLSSSASPSSPTHLFSASRRKEAEEEMRRRMTRFPMPDALDTIRHESPVDTAVGMDFGTTYSCADENDKQVGNGDKDKNEQAVPPLPSSPTSSSTSSPTGSRADGTKSGDRGGTQTI